MKAIVLRDLPWSGNTVRLISISKQLQEGHDKGTHVARNDLSNSRTFNIDTFNATSIAIHHRIFFASIRLSPPGGAPFRVCIATTSSPACASNPRHCLAVLSIDPCIAIMEMFMWAGKSGVSVSPKTISLISNLDRAPIAETVFDNIRRQYESG